MEKVLSLFVKKRDFESIAVLIQTLKYNRSFNIN